MMARGLRLRARERPARASSRRPLWSLRGLRRARCTSGRRRHARSYVRRSGHNRYAGCVSRAIRREGGVQSVVPFRRRLVGWRAHCWTHAGCGITWVIGRSNIVSI